MSIYCYSFNWSAFQLVLVQCEVIDIAYYNSLSKKCRKLSQLKSTWSYRDAYLSVIRGIRRLEKEIVIPQIKIE
jgi:hypothetical protein